MEKIQKREGSGWNNWRYQCRAWLLFKAPWVRLVIWLADTRARIYRRQCDFLAEHRPPLDEVQRQALADCGLKPRVSAALTVLALGADRVGVLTHGRVMYPATEYDEDDVRRAAASLLASVQAELIAELPPQAIERILRGRSERLSFACGDG